MSNLTQFKSVGLSNRGAYSAGVTYYIDDVVTYGGASYACTVNGTAGVTPTTTANWGVLVSAPTLAVATTGSGTNPANFTLSVSGNTVTLNRA